MREKRGSEELGAAKRYREKLYAPKRYALKSKWRPAPVPIAAALLIWLGALVLLYPTIASWLSQYDQSRLIEAYSSRVEEGLTPPAAEQINDAKRYNEALNSGAILAAGERLPTGEGVNLEEGVDYWSLLRAGQTEIMSRVRISSINVDLPVYHGTSDLTLEKGAGHLEGTSMPIGGPSTHTVITAHRGLANATMFTNLNRVEEGDTFTIETLGEVLTYRVVKTQVVEPEETEAIRTIPGADMATLVTCTPLGINTQRILVTGERITPTPVADTLRVGAVPEVPGFPWWIPVLTAATLLAAGYVWRSGFAV